MSLALPHPTPRSLPSSTTANAYQSSLNSLNGNAFLTVVNTNLAGTGSLVYSTYLGGNGAGSLVGDLGEGVTVDNNGNAYIVGQTTSNASGPFPTTSNAYQSSLNSANGNAFVAEIAIFDSGAQSLLYSTYFGGSTTSIVGDFGAAIALDAVGNVYVVGDAESEDFPVTPGVFQTTNSTGGKAFAAKFDLAQSGTQSLLYSTFLGGTNGPDGENGNGVAIDANGDAFVVGDTSSSDFPTTPDAFQSSLKSSGWNAFLTEIKPDGSNILYSTYLGGSSAFGDVATGVALDPLGNNAYLSGYTESSDFPTTSGAYQTSLQGGQSGFVTKAILPTSIVSIQVNPQSSTLIVGATQQFSATGTLANGNTQDVTAIANWTSSNTSVVAAANLQGYPLAMGAGTATITATVYGISGSATITVNPAPAPPVAPVINTVSSTSGGPGTQVTISGSNFGSTQANGQVWLGSTLGIVTSWSDTQIIANVATASTSGIAQVQQNGVLSNSVTFTINSATITSISSNCGVAGTQVTISGSGFGSTQGSGQVRLGNMSGVVVSWSDSQVVATVAAGAGSGAAQILQNGIWSNAVPFNINTPQITGVSPNSGSAGTAVTITGSGFGGAQGSGGAVWIGSTYGVVVSWSDSQVVANVASGALSGVVRVQQNGVWSNSVAFTVPPTDGSSPLTMMPNTLSMTVGETHTIKAINAQGQSVTGLTWASSDTTIVSLSTDDPPILTAVAAGRATITAGNASADVTVYSGSSFPQGTVQWSNPGDGSGVSRIVPAVPSSSGVDVFAFQNSGNVAAIKTDGTIAWTANSVYSAIPDFQGGLVVTAGLSVYDINGATGQSNPAYTSPSNNYISTVAASTDGTIFAVDGDTLVGIDPSSGAAKFRVQMQDSTSSSTNTNTIYCYDSPVPPDAPGQSYRPTVGNLMIAGDGYAYLPYVYTNGVGVYQGWCVGQSGTSEHLRLLRVGTAGDATTFDLGDWSGEYSVTAILDPCCTYDIVLEDVPIPSISWATPISNADQGVLFSWSASTGNSSTYTLTTTSGTAVASQGSTSIPGQDDLVYPVLQAQDGSFVGTVYTSAGQSMVDFNASGNVIWSVPNYSPAIATADDGVIAESSDGLTTATFDQNGNATGQGDALGLPFDWSGNAYYTTASASVSSNAGTPPNYGPTYAALLGGNQTANGTAIQQVQTNQPQGSDEQLPPTGATLNTNYNSIELLTSLSPAQIFSQYVQTFAGAQPGNNNVANAPANTNVTAPGQTITFKLHGLMSLGQGPFSVEVERFDTTADTISVVTLKGHPLEGWRYWRVYSVGTNDVVIETGAADLPGPGLKNYWGYYLFAFDQIEMWRQYLEYIKGQVGAPQGSTFEYNLVQGEWGYRSQGYILNNVCQASWCN